MKRSVINKNILWAMDACRKLGFNLPAFAYWTKEDWARKEAGNKCEHMHSVAQGWDVTDYNSGDFDRTGAVLFTLRNGNIYNNKMGTPYCEKIIAMKGGQMLPMHFHYTKTEDIINRCGGTLCVRVFNAKSEAEGYAIDTESDVHLRMDGVPVTIPAGGTVEVTNGNSITLFPYIYHEFFAKKEDGDLIVGEVSSINDDSKDNHFVAIDGLDPIEEDEDYTYPLCNGYKQ